MADREKESHSVQSWLLPVTTALIGALAGIWGASVSRMNSGDALAKDYVQMSIEILKAPPLSSSDQDTILMQKQLRIWALKVVNQYGKVPIEGKLSDYLANPGGNALLSKVLGSSRITHFDKTDTQLYLCKSAIKDAGALKLVKGIYDEILSSNEFGSSKIAKNAWTDEPGMSTSDISGAVTIIADKGHPEQQLIPQLKGIIQSQLTIGGLNLPVKAIDKAGSKPTPWLLSVIVCPTSP